MQDPIRIVKSLADQSRARIACALARTGELCACQITELLQVSGATASRHLSILVQSGILTSRKKGRWIYYRLHPNARKPKHPVERLLSWLIQAMEPTPSLRADRLALEKIIAAYATAPGDANQIAGCCSQNKSLSE